MRRRDDEVGPRATVLVIDNIELLRECMTEALEDTGRFNVVVAASGREGLGLLLRAGPPFDVVVLDCRMLGGLRVLGRLRQARPDLPVIAVSADPGHRRIALDRGARAFVGKIPASFMRDLLAVLHEVLVR